MHEVTVVGLIPKVMHFHECYIFAYILVCHGLGTCFSGRGMCEYVLV
jgi:hypothetical protein